MVHIAISCNGSCCIPNDWSQVRGGLMWLGVDCFMSLSVG